MEQAVTNYRRSSGSGSVKSPSVPPYPLAVAIGTDPGLFSAATSHQLRAIKPASQRVPDQHNMLTTGGLMVPVFSGSPPPPGCYACRGLPLNASECCGITEPWRWRVPFNEGGWTSVPLDEFMRAVAWKVPPPPPHYNSSEAITGQQLALLLRNTDTHPLLALSGSRASEELSKVFAERRQHSDLCQREAAEECRRFTELVLQQQRAEMNMQCRQCNANNQHLAGAPWKY